MYSSMAPVHAGRVAGTLAVAVLVAVIAASADDATQARVFPDDDVSATHRRHVQPLIYHVDEHLPLGSLVADLRTDLASVCDDGDCTNDDPTRFSLLHQRPATISGLFSVYETTGVVRSSGVVDREEVCSRRQTVCSVVLEVAVYYAAADAFDVAVLEVCNVSFLFTEWDIYRMGHKTLLSDYAVYSELYF